MYDVGNGTGHLGGIQQHTMKRTERQIVSLLCFDSVYADSCVWLVTTTHNRAMFMSRHQDL